MSYKALLGYEEGGRRKGDLTDYTKVSHIFFSGKGSVGWGILEKKMHDA